jgi:hypothetical protein
VDDPQLIAWLTEASLFAKMDGSITLKDLLDNPNLFPFSSIPYIRRTFDIVILPIEYLVYFRLVKK